MAEDIFDNSTNVDSVKGTKVEEALRHSLRRGRDHNDLFSAINNTDGCEDVKCPHCGERTPCIYSKCQECGEKVNDS